MRISIFCCFHIRRHFPCINSSTILAVKVSSVYSYSNMTKFYLFCFSFTHPTDAGLLESVNVVVNSTRSDPHASRLQGRKEPMRALVIYCPIQLISLLSLQAILPRKVLHWKQLGDMIPALANSR